MARQETEKEYFRKKDNNLYFSIPSNDKQRKTFAGLDGTGFIYLILALVPALAVTLFLVYLVQFKHVDINNKLMFLIIFLLIGYMAVSWTLCSHDSNTGKQTFSVLYQMVKYRLFQPKLIRPKFANRKNTILKIEVGKDEETIQKGETITTKDIYRARRERARTHSDEEEKLTD
ncbi:hypothetical protein H7900_11760 [Staphylococcus haemolyticus]|uniref:hypothetical protein n=1 Tax=Staphylococcus haemolyticus TaxID=1283 RepID=UPI001642A048|nr:hypothetical protein [Staphylococcus haemolyticus]MBC3106286.1 hypothetical protein [Staphylococcus haemolyticus]